MTVFRESGEKVLLSHEGGTRRMMLRDELDNIHCRVQRRLASCVVIDTACGDCPRGLSGAAGHGPYI